jgi:glucokinase
VDGRLLKGEIGRAGHLGHNCLDPEGSRDVTGIPGSIEVAIGNCMIAERTGNRFQTTHQLIRSYEAGDAFASVIWLKAVKALGCSISSYINLFDPGCVIVGGGIARAGKSLFEPLEKFVRDTEWQPGGHKVPILPAELGEIAGAFGAAWNAIQQRTA